MADTVLRRLYAAEKIGGLETSDTRLVLATVAEKRVMQGSQ